MEIGNLAESHKSAAIPVKSGIFDRLEDEARERMSQGGKGVEKVPHLAKAREEAAGMFPVNPHYISDAKRISRPRCRKASPDAKTRRWGWGDR
jgi:hypothetical protein